MNDLNGQSTGRYHIIEKLGMGGMAVVYRAYDTVLDCDVAIKFIRLDKLTTENGDKARKRFKIEAQKTAKLTHPNIVTVTDYGEFEGTPFLVMRFINSGKTLKTLLGKPLPIQDAVDLILPIAKALEHAHKAGIVHRDVKPSNILLTEHNFPMLTDFGVAKVLEVSDGTTGGLTSDGMALGTPEYMSPEQWEGKGIDQRADIYSLGVILYEMVTGQVPYSAETIPAILIKLLRDPLPRPSKFVPGIPESVEKILFKALAKDPADRFTDMGAFIEALDKLDPINTSRAKRRQTPTSKKKTFVPWIVIGCIVALLLAAILFIPKTTWEKINPFAPEQIYLSDLEPTIVNVGAWWFSVGEYQFNSYDDGVKKGDPIVDMNGKAYPHALFVHAPGQVYYELDKGYQSLTVTIFNTGKETKEDGVLFRVWGDYRLLYTSQAITNMTPPETVSVDISGVDLLMLETNEGINNISDWSVWGDPILTK